MGILDLFRRRSQPVEVRASGTGYTAAIMAARASYIAGVTDLAEMTATVQACVSLWEGALASADVQGTDLLDRRMMAVVARALALRGEFVGVIGGEGITPASDWDVATRNGRPVAYRVGIPEAGGGRTETLLVGEVLHVRLGSDPVAPWSGTPPLRRAALSANLLHEIEAALRDTFRDAPFGSQTLPLPAITQAQMDQYSDGFRGRRGRTLLFASDITGEMIKAPAPAQLTPRLSDAETVAHLDAARGAIAMAFGVLPGLLNPATTGPMVREAQRHLATWTLQPIAELLAEEATVKLGGAVSIDVHRALQSFDAGGSARALAGIMQALATAKDAGLSDAQVAAAFGALDWNEARG